MEIHRNPPDPAPSAFEEEWNPSSTTVDAPKTPFAVVYLVGCVLCISAAWLVHEVVSALLRPDPARQEALVVALEVALGLLLVLGFALLRWVCVLDEASRRDREVASGLQEMQAVLRRRNRELERQSRTDDLTGVGNRLLLNETLEFETQRCDRYGEALSIAVLEVEGLRGIHNGMGRVAVDDVLRQVAAVVQSTMRISDQVFRRGDCEFVVVWPGMDGDQAVANMERLDRAFRSELAADASVGIRCSIGATSYSHGEGGERLLARADLARKNALKDGVMFLGADSPARGTTSRR